MSEQSDDPARDPKPVGGLLGTVVRGVGLAASGYLLTQILTLAAYLVLARLATPEDFGQLAAASVLVGLSSIMVESGMLAALIHREERIDEAASTAVISTVASGLGLGLLALAASPLVGEFFDSETVAAVAALMSGLILLQAIPIVPEALLQRRFSFLRRVVVEPLSVIAFGVTAAVATKNGMGVWGLALGRYASAVAEIVLSWALLRWRPRFRQASFSTWRELVDYGRHVFGATMILRVGEQIPVALLGRFVGAGALGQYRYGMRVAALPHAAVLASASYVIFPALARIAAEPARLRAAFLRSLRLIMAIAMPLGLILVPIGEPLVVLAFGEPWRDAGEAVIALAAFAALQPISSLAAEGFKATGRPDILPRLYLVTSIGGGASAAALLSFGLIGVAAGISVGAALGAAYALAMCTRVLAIPIKEMRREIAPFAAAAGVMAAVLLPIGALLDPSGSGLVAGLALLAAELFIGGAVYIAGLRVLAPAIGPEVVELIRGARRPSGATERRERELAAVEDPGEELAEARRPGE